MNYPIKLTLKTELPAILILLATVLSSFYFYAHFPEMVPTHWNFAGEVDGWGTRWQGAFIIPIMLVAMYALFLLLPILDPKKERYSQFAKTYHIFKNLILIVLALVYFLASFNGLGFNIPIQYTVPVIIGLLFIVMGNYMGKLKRNWFIGIRTPWTLSSEEVWNKTHRVGGYLFVLAGLSMMLTPFLPKLYGYLLFGVMMVLIIFGTLAYSYFLYLKEKKNDKNNELPKSQN
ncbi:MAG: Immunity protein SdpI [Parcubacteria group bacterium ADurb.Bin316]|nr:MAG: Immunity protein SdpI [Parcubacteria group bacterium ADurb.Bin316]HOZ55713.1 SdpI family protein [bacterium]